jgi:hypothetical protein
VMHLDHTNTLSSDPCLCNPLFLAGVSASACIEVSMLMSESRRPPQVDSYFDATL